MPKHLKGCKNNTECDALLINSSSRTDTYPAITVRGTGNSTQHEASVSQINAEQIFYMQQRGLSEGPGHESRGEWFCQRSRKSISDGIQRGIEAADRS